MTSCKSIERNLQRSSELQLTYMEFLFVNYFFLSWCLMNDSFYSNSYQSLIHLDLINRQLMTILHILRHIKWPNVFPIKLFYFFFKITITRLLYSLHIETAVLSLMYWCMMMGTTTDGYSPSLQHGLGIYFMTHFHIIWLVHYILYHILKHCIARKHWI